MTRSRNINAVVRAINDELRQISEEEGPDGMLALEYADVVVDYTYGSQLLRVGVDFQGKRIWSKQLPFSRQQLEEGAVSDDTLRPAVTAAMRGTLSLFGQMHHARLDKMFPKSIKEVTVEFNVEKRHKIIHVHFHNGHVATADEHEAKTDLFSARCAMLYDLPPL